jgi:hypothetical protein
VEGGPGGAARLRGAVLLVLALASATCSKQPVGPANASDAPQKLAFIVQPSSVDSGNPIAPPVRVAVQDSLGATVTAATNTITVALGTNPGGGALSGTLTTAAVGGVASFSDLRVSRSGAGYTLTATSANVTAATSAAFTIRSTAAVPPTPFTGIAAAGIEDSTGHTCGVAAGILYCWGNNASGQLGDGTTTERTSPVKVAGGTGFAAVSTGGAHSCAITTAGIPYCWGDNTYGQLGNGSGSPTSSTPVRVAGGLTFAAISAGGSHSCGLTSSGVLYCWGYNGDGELGDGTTADRATPVAVYGGTTFASISAGGAHTCALNTAGIAYCWGYDGNGELGDGGSFYTVWTTPVAVAGGLRFAAISAADFFTCGVTTAGAAYCWGFNIDGELGDGTNSVSKVPSRVMGGLSLTSISSSGEHTCAITPTGDMYCWGYNCAGQLGFGNLGDLNYPVAVLGGLSFSSVSVGGVHSCGVTKDGIAYCWGNNTGGELGDGTTTGRMTPVRVVGP